MPIIFIEREEEVIRALHLASFNGNIGDIANHVGFWNLFKKYVTNDVEVTYLEIREYYKSWNLRQFDDSFADLVNRYDLLVIGGGNFFDVKWDYSTTGTTLNISDEILRKIHIPIVFNGLGVDYSPNMCLAKVKDCFGSFIKYLDSRSDKFLVSVRNDDSKMLLDQFFDGSSLKNIIQIPDGGFFTSAGEYRHPEIPDDKTVIAINTVRDRMEDRWGDKESYNQYCNEFSLFIDKAISRNPNLHFVFVPHIPSDLQAISDVLNAVQDYNCRRNITIAPYLNGIATPGEYLVDLYRKSAVAVGMRYHSNICSIAMHTPTIGIVTLKKHVELYRNIGMYDRLFNVNENSFSEKLYERLIWSIENRDLLTEQNALLVRKLEQKSVEYYEKIAQLLYGKVL